MKATLKQWRGLRGMTQEDLAEAVGVSPTTVSQWETGKTPPRKKNKARLRAVLNLDKDDSIIVPKYLI